MSRESHSVETPVACKKYGGKWDNKWRICLESDGELGGCAAPTKGVKFCWRGIDMFEDYGPEPHFKGKYLTEILGFDLRNDNIIWDLAEWEGGFDFVDSMEDAVEYGKEIACEIASDILRGKAEGWMFSYIGPGHIRRKRPRPFIRYSVVPDEPSEDHLKSFSFRRRHAKQIPPT